MTRSIVKQRNKSALNVEPILGKVLQEAQKEHEELQEAFQLMGWGDLPGELKIEIKDDIAAMVDEYKGQYSTRDPFVLKRRQRVIYWIENYQEGMCSLGTAVHALRVKSI